MGTIFMDSENSESSEHHLTITQSCRSEQEVINMLLY